MRRLKFALESTFSADRGRTVPARTTKTKLLGASQNGDIKQRLLAERREVISEITSRATNGDASPPSAQDTDYAAISQLRDMEFSRRDTLNRRLQLVDAALERMDAGSYGVCTTCGTPIDEKRIAADPAVSLCITCQAATEAGQLLSTI